MVIPLTSKHTRSNLMLQCTEKVIKNKVGLLNLAEELGNVSRAYKIMGLSRDTFYRIRQR